MNLDSISQMLKFSNFLLGSFNLSLKILFYSTDQQVALTIKMKLEEALARSAGRLAHELLNKTPMLLQNPIVFEKPVYGDSKPTFTDFMAPGVICM